MNEEQAATTAFKNARVMLNRLIEIGVVNPSVTLYHDGSGRINISSSEALQKKKIEPEQVYDICGTRRTSPFGGADEVVLDFCESMKDPDYGVPK